MTRAAAGDAGPNASPALTPDQPPPSPYPGPLVVFNWSEEKHSSGVQDGNVLWFAAATFFWLFIFCL